MQARRHFFGRDDALVQAGYDPPLKQFYFHITTSDDEVVYAYPEVQYRQTFNPGVGGMLLKLQQKFPDNFVERPADQFADMYDKMVKKCAEFEIAIPQDLRQKLIMDGQEAYE